MKRENEFVRAWWFAEKKSLRTTAICRQKISEHCRDRIQPINNNGIEDQSATTHLKRRPSAVEQEFSEALFNCTLFYSELIDSQSATRLERGQLINDLLPLSLILQLVRDYTAIIIRRKNTELSSSRKKYFHALSKWKTMYNFTENCTNCVKISIIIIIFKVYL